MSPRERILMIRLMEIMGRNPGYARSLGIAAGMKRRRPGS